MGGWVGLIETGFFCFVCFRGGKVNGGGTVLYGSRRSVFLDK